MTILMIAFFNLTDSKIIIILLFFILNTQDIFRFYCF